jgi:hemerythrin
MIEDPTPDAATHKAAFASGEYFDEHRALRAILNRVRHCRDLNLLIPLLEELHRMLGKHFQQEEKTDGLFQAVSEAAPHYLGQVQELLAEHRKFLETTQNLTGEVKRLVEGPVASLFENTETLCNDLESHEQTENELLSDALYRDLGESG